MYGAATGNPVAVTDGGNVNVTTVYDNIVNVGRVVLRSNSVYHLPDINAAWVQIHASPNNGANIWLGGIIDHEPQPNVGYPIIPGATLQLPCTNSNQISLIPSNDGDTVYIIVGAVNSNAVITPGSPGTLDVTKPSIISTTPISGLSGQPINSTLSALADRALDPSTINAINISIIPSPAGWNPVADSSNPANILMLYSGNLASNTLHTVTINGLSNVNGYTMTTPFTYTFTTSNTITPPSTTPPTITATNPASGSTNVSTSVNPTITFSQSILSSSITTTSIRVTDVALVQFLTGYTFSLSADLKTVTINGLTLDNSKQYRIDVYNTNSPAGAGIENTVGVFLDNTYSITFTTVAPSTVLYNVAGSSGTYSSMNSTNFYGFVGFYANTSASKLIGEIPVSCSFIVKKVGNPPGSLVCQMDQIGSGGTQAFIKSFGSITANSVGTTDTTITFSFPTNTTALAFNRSLSLWYLNGNSSNYIMAKCSSSDAFDGSATCLVRQLYDASPVTTVQTIDLAGTISVSN
jgi:hypothetical protein